MSTDFEGEETDMGKPAASVTAPLADFTRKKATAPKGQSERQVKIKRMPVSMEKRWPGIASCMVTLASGKQFLFVRG